MDLSIFDVRGRRVAVIQSATLEAGSHMAAWNGRTDENVRCDPGVYFARLRAGDEVRQRSVILIK